MRIEKSPSPLRQGAFYFRAWMDGELFQQHDLLHPVEAARLHADKVHSARRLHAVVPLAVPCHRVITGLLRAFGQHFHQLAPAVEHIHLHAARLGQLVGHGHDGVEGIRIPVLKGVFVGHGRNGLDRNGAVHFLFPVGRDFHDLVPVGLAVLDVPVDEPVFMGGG
jgi:hypothetical protein